MNEYNTIHTYIDILVLFTDALLFIVQPSPHPPIRDTDYDLSRIQEKL